MKKIHNDHRIVPNDIELSSQDEKIGIWYYGKTGTGKSYNARKDFPNAFLKISNNKWWDGYKDEPNVIMDDFDKSHNYMGYHLKIWADRYAFPCEIKGGGLNIRPRHIIVTSNYHPKEIWPEEPSTLDPILRRFKIVRFMGYMDIMLNNNEEHEEIRQSMC